MIRPVGRGQDLDDEIRNDLPEGHRRLPVRELCSGVPALGEGKWQISDGGGQNPVWFVGGRAILYPGPEGAQLVEVNPDGDVFQAGTRDSLSLEIPEGAVWLGWGDVTADGERGMLAIASDGGRSGKPDRADQPDFQLAGPVRALGASGLR